jgi:hypothetical protein
VHDAHPEFKRAALVKDGHQPETIDLMRLPNFQLHACPADFRATNGLGRIIDGEQNREIA